VCGPLSLWKVMMSWPHRHRAMNGIVGHAAAGILCLFAWNTYNTTFNNPAQGGYSIDSRFLINANASDIISTPPGLYVWLSCPSLSSTIVLFQV